MPDTSRLLDHRGAGRRPAAAPAAYHYDDVVVLALARRGVSVGYASKQGLPQR